MTPVNMTRSQLAAMIDHAILRPQATAAEVRAGCEAARRCGVASACVRPCDVPLAAELLTGSGVAVCTVIAFPHGATNTSAKAAEAA